jgi:hypothetical protein
MTNSVPHARALSHKGGAATEHSAPSDRFVYECSLLLALHVAVLMPSQGKTLKHARISRLARPSTRAKPGFTELES